MLGASFGDCPGRARACDAETQAVLARVPCYVRVEGYVEGKDYGSAAHSTYSIKQPHGNRHYIHMMIWHGNSTEEGRKCGLLTCVSEVPIPGFWDARLSDAACLLQPSKPAAGHIPLPMRRAGNASPSAHEGRAAQEKRTGACQTSGARTNAPICNKDALCKSDDVSTTSSSRLKLSLRDVDILLPQSPHLFLSTTDRSISTFPTPIHHDHHAAEFYACPAFDRCIGVMCIVTERRARSEMAKRRIAPSADIISGDGHAAGHRSPRASAGTWRGWPPASRHRPDGQ